MRKNTKRILQGGVILAAYCLVMGTVAVTFAESAGAWVPVSISGSASNSCGTKTGTVTVVNHEREDAIVLSGFLPAGAHITPGTHTYSVGLPFSGNLVVRYPSDSTPRTSSTIHLSKPAPCPTTTTSTTVRPTTTTTEPQTTTSTHFECIPEDQRCNHHDTTTTEPKTSTSVPTVSNDCDSDETAAPVACVDSPQLAG